jgi:hypothetical protein
MSTPRNAQADSQAAPDWVTSHSIPDWVITQRRARGLCERCGDPATGEVTWADGRNHGTQLLCDSCWAKGEAAAQAAR